MSSSDTSTQEASAGRSWLSGLRNQVQQLFAFLGLILIFVVFSIAQPQVFPTYSNITGNILFSAVVIGLLALGATLVIITSGIDLSVGTGMTLCAVMSATFMVTWGLPVWLGLILTLLFGALIGFINGTNVAILGLPPFIATLAMMLIAQGLALVISNAAPIYFDATGAHAAFIWLSTGNLIPHFPNAVIVFLLAAIVAYILLSKTLLGRYDISIGSNIEATALSGINTRKWLIIIYAVAGVFTALGGIMISARRGSAPPATGAGYELQAIAAVVIGGTSLSGGKGTIVGTVIGALIIAVINNGLQIMSVRQEWQNVILGLVILIVVFIDQFRSRRLATS